MAQEGSVAPKERVNIVYKSATGDAKEEVELPLKILCMGDFTLRNDETPVEDRNTVNVNADNFDDVMAAHDLHLTMAVPDRISDAGPDASMTVDLDFKGMRDFTPDSIAQQVPELRRLIELREALKALKGPLGNTPAFRKKLQELIGDESARDRLLNELGLGGEDKA